MRIPVRMLASCPILPAEQMKLPQKMKPKVTKTLGYIKGATELRLSSQKIRRQAF